MKQLVFGLTGILALILCAGAARAQADKEAKAAAEPVVKQLEAFRHDDYDTAYTFASEEIRALFDRRGFEAMVRLGYPEIANSTLAMVTRTELGPRGSTSWSGRTAGRSTGWPPGPTPARSR